MNQVPDYVSLWWCPAPIADVISIDMEGNHGTTILSVEASGHTNCHCTVQAEFAYFEDSIVVGDKFRITKVNFGKNKDRVFTFTYEGTTFVLRESHSGSLPL